MKEKILYAPGLEPGNSSFGGHKSPTEEDKQKAVDLDVID